MRIKLTTLIFVGLIFLVRAASAQDAGYAVEKITDNIYKLSYQATGYVVKVIAFVGDDGILLIDTGHKPKAEALKAKLLELWQGSPKVIIISHEHIEHLGGTEIFGKSPIVIGHSSLRTVLKQGHFLFDEFTDATYPDIAFSDSLSVFFNGEEIKLISVAGGHSGSDIIVWFTKSAVACVDGLCNWPYFPSIDNKSGDVLEYPEAVKRVIDLLPSNTKIIPGHGQDCTMTEFRQFHDMLVQTRDIVKSELAKGKTVEALQKDDVLKDFKSYEGSYTSADKWIEYLVKGCQEHTSNTLKSLYEPMYYTLKEKGIDSAIAHYNMLKLNHASEYEFKETTPAVIGYLLFEQGRYPEAIRFFQLSLNEYPKGVYANLSYDYLGQSFEKTNDFAQALMSYKKLLELTPEDTATARKVKELEKK